MYQLIIDIFFVVFSLIFFYTSLGHWIAFAFAFAFYLNLLNAIDQINIIKMKRMIKKIEKAREVSQELNELVNEIRSEIDKLREKLKK